MASETEDFELAQPGDQEPEHSVESMEGCVNMARALDVQYRNGVPSHDICRRGIDAANSAVALTPRDHDMFWNRLLDVSLWTHRMFRDFSGDILDIDHAVSAAEEARQIVTKETFDHLEINVRLAEYHLERSSLAPGLDDINRVISLYDEADTLSIRQHASLSLQLGILGRLARLLEERSQLLSSPVDLDRAIRIHERILNHSPGDAKYVFHTALCIRHRYLVNGNPDDIRRSVDLLDGLASREPGLDIFPGIVTELGATLSQLYLQTEDPADLHRAVAKGIEAVDRTRGSDTFEERHALSSLSRSLILRFQDGGDVKDIELSVLHAIESIQGSSEDADRSLLLHNHASRLLDRFDYWGDIQDLDQAEQGIMTAIRLESGGDVAAEFSSRACRTMKIDLALVKSRRFDITGIMDYLDQAIEILTKYLDSVQDSTQETVLASGQLTYHLLARHKLVPASEGISRAIEETERLLGTLKPGFVWKRRSVLTLLSQCYTVHFSQTKSIGDLDKAIENLQEALADTPIGHTRRASTLVMLAEACRARSAAIWEQSTRTGSVPHFHDSLEQGVLHAREARTQVTQGSSLCKHATLVLARCLFGVCRQSPTPDLQIGYLDEAIGYFEQLIELDGKSIHSEGDDHNGPLRLASSSYGSRFQLSHLEPVFFHIGQAYHLRSYLHRSDALDSLKLRDLEQATLLFRQGFSKVGSAPLERLLCGAWVAHLCSWQSEWSEAIKVWREALPLIQVLTSRSLLRTDQLKVVENLQGLSRVACSASLSSGADPSEALAMLELGRGVVANFLLEARLEMPNLKPEQASAFVDARSKLEAQKASSPPHAALESAQGLTAWTSRSRAIYKAEKRLQLVISSIQADPETKDFLGPQSVEEVRSVIGEEVIVMINVSERSDAFLIEKAANKVRTVELTRLTWDDIEWWATRLRDIRPMMDLSMLTWLWEAVALPVLEYLGFIHRDPNSSLPRIVWILTGPLSYFPIHAAGTYDRPNSSVMDFVISSYSLSLRSFVISKRKQMTPSIATTDVAKTAVLVAMDSTPGFPPLQFAAKEIDTLARFCPALHLENNRPRSPQRDEVLYALSRCAFFHFAGHGVSDPLQPENSGLVLNGTILTVADLLNFDFQDHSPFLGFLSACLTGANDAGDLVDEAVHLISAFQISGFRHVIGALWQVQDGTCEKVSETVYGHLASFGISDDGVSRGLHKALLAIRDLWRETIFEGGTTEQGHNAADNALKISPEEAWKEEGLPHHTRPLQHYAAGGLTGLERHARPRQVPMRQTDTCRLVRADWIPFVHFGA